MSTKGLFIKVKNSRFSTRLIVALIVIIPLAAGAVYIFYSLEKGSREKTVEDEADKQVVAQMDEELALIPHSNEVKKIARVGEEYIFESDIPDYAFRVGKKPNEISREEAIEGLIAISLVLQEGEKKGLISLTPAVFNNPFKDYQKRFDLYNEVILDFDSERAKGNTHAGFILVSYFTVADQAKAEADIEYYYSLVKNDSIKIDTVASTFIPSSSEVNGSETIKYFEMQLPYTIIGKSDFSDPDVPDNVVQFFVNAKEGDVSEIFTGENYFIFYQVLQKNEFTSVFYEEWLTNLKAKFKVVYL